VPALLLALLASGRVARDARAAVERPSIRMNVESCPPAWDTEIRLTLAVELGDERLASAPTGEPPATPDSARAGAAGYTLNVRCDEQRARVVARDSKTAVTLERTLTDLPDATAPRLLALVAVELLTTFDPALRRRLEAPAKLTRPSPAAEPPAPPAPPPARRLSLTAGWVYRTFLTTGGVQAWGGTLDGRRASQDGRWSAGVGVEIARDARSTSIGQTSALLASLRASAGMRVPLAGDRFALSLDLGARGGIVRLSGNADIPNVDASTVVRPWAGPAATLRAQTGTSWFYAEISAEAGWAAVSASGRVNAEAALAASGPWLALSLGLGGRG
jgi:hypothetical protein